MIRRFLAILAAILPLVLSSCGSGGSSNSPPPPPPPPPAPSILSVAPAAVTVGIQLASMQVIGANFASGSQLYIDGQPVDSVALNSGTLQLDVDTSFTSTPGTHQFLVKQQSGTSNTATFTVYAPQLAPLVMNAIPSYMVGYENNPPSVVVADVNEDGFADVLVPIWANDQIAILDGNADGSLSPSQFLSMPQAWAIAVGDVSGDGNPDLVSITSDQASTSTVSVLLGDGHGSFQPASSSQTFSGVYPHVVGLADLDGDGRPDLILSVELETGTGFKLVWLKSTGGGNFAAPVMPARVAKDSVALADFNHDGKPDFIYGLVDATTGISVFHVLLNQGGGHFTDELAAGLGGTSGVPTAIDFNLDGIPDLVIEQTVGQATTMSSFQGNGDGSFTLVTAADLSNLYDFVVGDFDHDGFPDLAGSNASQILYLFGDGHGNFTPQGVIGTGTITTAVGDINGDGLPDVVVADYASFVSVSLGRNDRGYPVPMTLTPAVSGNIALGDINGDGLPEIFIGGIPSPPVEQPPGYPGTVFLNQGNSSFKYAALTDPTSFWLYDFTGRGVVDLFGATSTNPLYAVIWPNNGTLDFYSAPVTVQPSSQGRFTVADVDGDGYLDIVSFGQIYYGNGAYQFTTVPLDLNDTYVVGNFTGSGRMDIATQAAFYRNTGNRTFQTTQEALPLQSNFYAVVGDFNGDGKDDLVFSEDGSTLLQIWYSRGDGTFYEGALLSASLGVPGLAADGGFVIGDFDGDGRLDIAVGLPPSETVAIFFNQGNGQFSLSYLAGGVNTFGMATGKLNRDGKLGLVLESFPFDFAPPKVNVLFHK